MARRTVDLKFPRAAILWQLHKTVADYENIAFTVETISSVLDVPTQVLALAFDELEDEGLCRKNTEEELKEHPDGGRYYTDKVEYIEITREGVYEVERWGDDFYDRLVQWVTNRDADNGVEEPKPADSAQENGTQNVRSGADVWEPLSIDRTTPEYIDAVAAVENVLKTVEGDNGYTANEPDERDQIVWSLKEGLATIKEKLPSLAQVNSLVVAPIKYLAKKFAESAMGVAAKVAVPKLMEWIASLLP